MTTRPMSRGAGEATAHRRKLLAILGAALTARLVFVICYPQVPVVNDALSYDQSGYYLAFGRALLPEIPGSAAIAKGPLYPTFLAGIYRLFGHDHAAVRVAQAIISSLAVLLIYGLATQLFNRGVGLLASLLAAVYPPFISYPGQLLTETLSLSLLLAFVYSLLRALGRSQVLPWVSAGLLGGLVVLTREEMLVIVVLSALAVWWWRVGTRRVGVLLVSAALVILPWTLRNSSVLGDVALISPGGGGQLWISTVELDGPEWTSTAAHLSPSRTLVAGLSPSEADRMLRDDAIRRVVEDPLRYLKLCLNRIPAFWFGGHSSTFRHLEDSLQSYVAQGSYLQVAIKLTLLAYNMGMILLGFAGMSLAWSNGMVNRRLVVLLTLPVAAKALTHFFLFARLRYQVPIMSFLIIFAAFALWHLRRVIRHRLPAPA